ncbi:MAG: hypothetical protein LBS96_02230 [Oscillospiraceae bacterium]|jgi:hypothetical protein|nr:hypothetical protein [Oscillospiraceae bacterium]
MQYRIPQKSIHPTIAIIMVALGTIRNLVAVAQMIAARSANTSVNWSVVGFTALIGLVPVALLLYAFFVVKRKPHTFAKLLKFIVAINIFALAIGLLATVGQLLQGVALTGLSGTISTLFTLPLAIAMLSLYRKAIDGRLPDKKPLLIVSLLYAIVGVIFSAITNISKEQSILLMVTGILATALASAAYFVLFLGLEQEEP